MPVHLKKQAILCLSIQLIIPYQSSLGGEGYIQVQTLSPLTLIPDGNHSAIRKAGNCDSEKKNHVGW